MKICAEHDSPEAASLFAYELHSQLCGMAPGTSIVAASSMTAMMRFIAFLVPREEVFALIDLDGTARPYADPGPPGVPLAAPQRPPAPPLPPPGGTPVRLEELAFTRSGEKGETINVGVIARRPANLPAIRAALTPAAVAQWFAHLFPDPAAAQVEVFDVPGIDGFNLVLHGALPGGINASNRLDSAAKSVGQQLLDFPVVMA
jgi:hypothetical protein